MLTQIITLGSLDQLLANESETIVKGGLVVLGIAIFVITGAVKKISTTRQRELTKRELAAYVAEGSIAPDDAHKLLAIGEHEDARELVIKRAADGWISSKKADQILKAMDAKASKA